MIGKILGWRSWFSRGPDSSFQFGSGWFLWYTCEFVLTLVMNLYILIRYWQALSPLMIVFLLFGMGGIFILSPYIRTVRICSVLEDLRNKSSDWDNDQKVLLKDAVSITRQAVLASSYFPLVALLLFIIGYGISHGGILKDP